MQMLQNCGSEYIQATEDSWYNVQNFLGDLIGLFGYCNLADFFGVPNFATCGSPP